MNVPPAKRSKLLKNTSERLGMALPRLSMHPHQPEAFRRPSNPMRILPVQLCKFALIDNLFFLLIKWLITQLGVLSKASTLLSSFVQIRLIQATLFNLGDLPIRLNP